MQSPPFVIAHRAGNDLAALRRATTLGVPWVEADLRLFRGRVEVRHLRTIGPVRILWDRWYLAPRSTPRLLLDELLAAVGPETELVLDLKGPDPRLGRRVLAALRTVDGPCRITICSRSWAQLRRFRDEPGVRVLHSVGNVLQLAWLLRRARHRPVEGVSVHARLLTPRTGALLRDRVGLVLSWPVNTAEEARRLLGLGVHGLISDEPEGLAAALTR
jgi:glycerophosphoryl diester phosphodiesterase